MNLDQMIEILSIKDQKKEDNSNAKKGKTIKFGHTSTGA